MREEGGSKEPAIHFADGTFLQERAEAVSKDSASF
jgi:hypothetical protein